ncbi:MAG: hypothetical protein L6R35_005922, partial [Caloplaca aegaea]
RALHTQARTGHVELNTMKRLALLILLRLEHLNRSLTKDAIPYAAQSSETKLVFPEEHWYSDYARAQDTDVHFDAAAKQKKTVSIRDHLFQGCRQGDRNVIYSPADGSQRGVPEDILAFPPVNVQYQAYQAGYHGSVKAAAPFWDLQQSNREYCKHTKLSPGRQLQTEDHGNWQNQDVGINDCVGRSRNDRDNPSIDADRITQGSCAIASRHCRDVVASESNACSGRKTDPQEDQVAHRLVGAEEVIKEKQHRCLDKEDDRNVGETQGVEELEHDRVISGCSPMGKALKLLTFLLDENGTYMCKIWCKLDSLDVPYMFPKFVIDH